MMHTGIRKAIVVIWSMIAGAGFGSCYAQTRFPPLANQPGAGEPGMGQPGPGQPGAAQPGAGQPYPGTGTGGGDPQLAARLDAMMHEERRDMGVSPTAQLHAGPMHGPTPNQIPGGQVITTKGLHGLVQGSGVPFALFDVLGASETLPGALPAVPASQPGSFQDQNQRQFGQFLQRVTQGNPETVLVFYCQGVYCWMSYNAALRAIHFGYRNVLWYRGGLEAWKHAGLPTHPAGPAGLPQAMPPKPPAYSR